MEKKNTIFSKAYKIGVIVFSLLVLIVSFTLFSILRTFDYSREEKKVIESETFTNEPDTVRIEVVKPIKQIDTVYILCKKKHCEEIHIPKDTAI